MKITLSANQLVEILEQLKQQSDVGWVTAIGKALAAGSDDDQARILCAAASALLEAVEEHRRERPHSLNMGADWQWMQVGKHLVDCQCSTEQGRMMIGQIWSGILHEQLKLHEHWLPVTARYLGGAKISVTLGIGDSDICLLIGPSMVRRMGEEMLKAADAADSGAR